MKNATPCTLLIAAALVVLAGCSSSDSTPAMNNSDSSPNGENTGGGQVLAKYNGTFTSPCESSGSSIPLVGATIITINVNDDSGSVRVFNYTDNACTTPGTPAEVFSEVSITYPGGTVDTPLGMADFVNLSPESLLIDGRQPTDIERQLLSGAGIGAAIYDIFLIKDTGLYIGQKGVGRDGTSVEKRPDTLRSEPYVLQ